MLSARQCTAHEHSDGCSASGRSTSTYIREKLQSMLVYTIPHLQILYIPWPSHGILFVPSCPMPDYVTSNTRGGEVNNVGRDRVNRDWGSLPPPIFSLGARFS
ncbi:hypothetical protein FIBSPDRAFT_475128 [Athelia psychrophila]|uniref:Uncharacterized protein n=1 Tax=Athelia psychrophila TaxID=1759441 RepID=A0A166L6A9_9AGAM|nr:hypothetical protein FIBSPDRAFT_467565 [Fibularhizoctonia sp. CBS 109695]KZP22615.1 hypothetical protein FIBSPDRAFT_475128 [Fibularhizoctonia sp. CBS 109695]